jgi:plastocyanin
MVAPPVDFFEPIDGPRRIDRQPRPSRSPPDPRRVAKGLPMKLRITSLAVLTVALVAAGCSSDAVPAAAPVTEPAPEAVTTEAPATEAPSDGPTIQIEGFAFSALDPVDPGTDVTVANLDGAQHTLTAGDGSFNTGGLDGGSTITITAPDVPGTYSFVCNIHPSMTGSLTVDG